MEPDFKRMGKKIITNTNKTKNMKTLKFTYSDSVAGMQSETFTLLSEIVKYIESFGWNGDSEGVIFQNDEPILEYVSREDSLVWANI